MSFIFTRLGPSHSREGFACGEPSLDRYLRKNAGQDAKKGFATVIVATRDGQPTKVLGYYALAAASVPFGRLPEEVAQKLPRYPEVPALLLGRLAVDTQCQRQHLGAYLLLDAMQRALANELAWAFFLVHAKHERAKNFYLKFLFHPFQDNPDHLWLSRKQVANLLQ